MFELLIAMALFLVISIAAFRLFSQQQMTSMNIQGQSGLNLALRNAVFNLQSDLANAGNGYYAGTNFPGWPVGVTMINRGGLSWGWGWSNSCYNSSTSTYSSNCFDQLNIIATAGLTPLHVTNSTGGSSPPGSYCSQTNGGGTVTAYALSPLGTSASATATAASYPQGSQLLFLNSIGTMFTTVVLTSNAQAVGSLIQFQFHGTNANGTNTLTNDPLNLTACSGTASCTITNAAGNSITTYQFCASDWVIKLAPIVYQVNTSNSSDPQLTRTAGGNTDVVMDQIIGFRVGAALWNDGSSNSQAASYNYDASTYAINTAGSTTVNVPYNFTLVRSLRISMIGRTAPNLSATFNYRNAFDNGPYQVQGTAVVVNPRNLSMNDH